MADSSTQQSRLKALEDEAVELKDELLKSRATVLKLEKKVTENQRRLDQFAPFEELCNDVNQKYKTMAALQHLLTMSVLKGLKSGQDDGLPGPRFYSIPRARLVPNGGGRNDIPSLFDSSSDEDDDAQGGSDLDDFSQKDSAKRSLHLDVMCDGCAGPIYGIRYKCRTCRNYDLCSTCKSKGIHGDHDMLMI